MLDQTYKFISELEIHYILVLNIYYPLNHAVDSIHYSLFFCKKHLFCRKI